MPSIYFFHRSVNMKILKQSAHIFNYLCQASAELNCIFSIPVLLMLTLRLVSATTYSYFFIYSIVQSNEVVKNMNMTSLIPVFAIMILLDWTLILVILSAADTPIYQVILKNLPQLFNRSMESKVFFFFCCKYISYYRISCVYCASDYFLCRTQDFPKLCRENLRSVLQIIQTNDLMERSALPYLVSVLLVNGFPEANSRRSYALVCCRTLYGWKTSDSFCKLIYLSFQSILNSQSS